MPRVNITFFREPDGRVPVREWLDRLRIEDRQAYSRCEARLRRLEIMGYELRRPEADYVGDGLYELRARRGHVNLRLIYCFHGREIVVLLHALTKEDRLPEAELRRALDRKLRLERNPDLHIEQGEP